MYYTKTKIVKPVKVSAAEVRKAIKHYVANGDFFGMVYEEEVINDVMKAIREDGPFEHNGYRYEAN